jgi:hypothetical protein
MCGSPLVTQQSSSVGHSRGSPVEIRLRDAWSSLPVRKRLAGQPQERDGQWRCTRNSTRTGQWRNYCLSVTSDGETAETTRCWLRRYKLFGLIEGCQHHRHPPPHRVLQVCGACPARPVCLQVPKWLSQELHALRVRVLAARTPLQKTVRLSCHLSPAGCVLAQTMCASYARQRLCIAHLLYSSWHHAAAVWQSSVCPMGSHRPQGIALLRHPRLNWPARNLTQV